MLASHFEIYQDVAGRFRWRLIASNGHVTATSGEAYPSFDAATRSVHQVREQSADAPIVRESVEA